MATPFLPIGWNGRRSARCSGGSGRASSGSAPKCRVRARRSSLISSSTSLGERKACRSKFRAYAGSRSAFWKRRSGRKRAARRARNRRARAGFRANRPAQAVLEGSGGERKHNAIALRRIGTRRARIRRVGERRDRLGASRRPSRFVLWQQRALGLSLDTIEPLNVTRELTAFLDDQLAVTDRAGYPARAVHDEARARR